MDNRIGRLSLAALVALSAASSVYGQVQTDRVALAAIAKKAKAASQYEKARATSLAKRLGLPLRLVSGGQIAEIYRFVGFTPLYRRTCNVEAAKTTSTSYVWPGGSLGTSLSGSGETLAIWDGGVVRKSHQEFGTRAVWGDSGSTADHGTAVGATMVAAGVSSEAKGMSYAANLKSFDWNDDTTEMATMAAAGLLVSNHSYGVWGDQWLYGFYDSYCQEWDNIAYAAPYYTIFQAAGNQQGSNTTKGAYDTITIPGAAKNCITVGAVKAISGGFTGDLTKISLASFSSCGPTDDGRIKPDIMGCGVSIYTASYSSDTAYAYWSGTSFSTPNASGSGALVQQHYKAKYNNNVMRSATLRGLLIHTAADGGNTGPDYKYGWGLMNTAATVTHITNSVTDSQAIQERVLNTGSTYSFDVASNGLTPLKVTICWTDPAGTPATEGTLDPTDLMLVNDLDLRITQGNTTYYPFILNPSSPSALATTGDNNRDNVEQVLISAPAAGIYTVTISHKGTGLKPSGQQAYSILVSGNAPRITAVTPTVSSVMGGLSTTGKVTLSKPAPSGGVSVALTASDPSAATVPTSVTVPEGATEAAFDIATAKHETAATIELRAELWGEAKTSNLIVSATPKVSGTVTLGDFAGSASTIPITVIVRQPGTTTAVETYTVTLSSTGAYSFLTTQVGTFDLAFKGSHWLRKATNGVSITTSGASQSLTLLNGDINNDNTVNLLDYNGLSLAWRATSSSSNWNANADLNGDGKVDLLDWNILSKNWRKSGDS